MKLIEAGDVAPYTLLEMNYARKVEGRWYLNFVLHGDKGPIAITNQFIYFK